MTDRVATSDVRSDRPQVVGKFFHARGRKLFVRGVTYGTFMPNADGEDYPSHECVERDFAHMTTHGINAVRTYTVPPRWLLDLARDAGLYVMVGLPGTQHRAFLDDREGVRAITEGVRAGVRACAGHEAVLAYAVGNEIPAAIVRWHGKRRVERFLTYLCRIVKQEDPGALVTYVNYPSTEYLQLPAMDFMSFNVYLEGAEAMRAYLARLQSLAGERPLLMAEIGLDSRRAGEAAQAQSLDWQIHSAFALGAAGTFVFAWTDEWHREGYEVEDWDFGLATRDRRPKPALAVVRRAYAEAPMPPDPGWPHVSVVVCSYNGSKTIEDTLDGLALLHYPSFDVTVVDDGSTDSTGELARRRGVRVIRTENRGLSSARNTGIEAAAGEIVAFTDDDARPDPHWLTYLASALVDSDHDGVGGPNLAPPGDGAVAQCVANAPGGPMHVLLDDRLAEHIPGCNMAFWKTALARVGGFDPRFRVAGDDVDLCWRIQATGGTIGFSAAAVVWHHRRNSLRAYWRQQRGYGKAEALLEGKWPEKYNAAGHTHWAGRIYGNGLTRPLFSRRTRIYGGTWGSAPFQSLQIRPPGLLASLPLMPDWYLLVLALAGLSALGVSWAPLRLAFPLLIVAISALVAQAVVSARHAAFPGGPHARSRTLALLAMTALLHLVQPVARLIGRVNHGLTPWRRHAGPRVSVPWPRGASVWSEAWHAPDRWLHAVESHLRSAGPVVVRGGEFDRWDLEIRGGIIGRIRILSSVEEYAGGKQMARFRFRPRWTAAGIALVDILALLAVGAAIAHAALAALVLGTAALLLMARAVEECALAMRVGLDSVHALRGIEASVPSGSSILESV